MTGWKGKTHAKGYEAKQRRVRNLQLLGYDPLLEEEARDRASEMKTRGTAAPGAQAGVALAGGTAKPAPAAPAGAAPPVGAAPPGGPAAPAPA